MGKESLVATDILLLLHHLDTILTFPSVDRTIKSAGSNPTCQEEVDQLTPSMLPHNHPQNLLNQRVVQLQQHLKNWVSWFLCLYIACDSSWHRGNGYTSNNLRCTIIVRKLWCIINCHKDLFTIIAVVMANSSTSRDNDSENKTPRCLKSLLSNNILNNIEPAPPWTLSISVISLCQA